ncbi:MAG TPA: ribonuclease E inhibitor RraB [bacterium]|nr:ribonuclease E inhibitor RraB [bacterium]
MDQDQEILEHLKERGSDLTKPHEVEYYVYFPTQEAAQTASHEIVRLGFRVHILADPSGNRWLCLSLKEFVPDYDTVVNYKRRFNELAKPYGGKCDGWGTQVEK